MEHNLTPDYWLFLGLCAQVLWRDPREGGASWRHLIQLPAKSFNQCVAVMDGFLYVVGGEDQNDARNQAKHAVSTLSRWARTRRRTRQRGRGDVELLEPPSFCSVFNKCMKLYPIPSEEVL